MKRRRDGRVLLSAVGLLILLILLWPLGYAVWLSFSPKEILEPPTTQWSLRWYRHFIASTRWRDALWNSLEVGVLAVAVAVVGGTGLALAVARHHFRGRRLLAGAVLLPLFVPALVLAMGLLPLQAALELREESAFLALAHALIGLPIVYLMVRSALEETSADLEQAARGLGARPHQVFLRVTLPLIRPAILAGSLMSFLLSFNEFTLALFLTDASTETLPRVLWADLRYTLSPLVAVASCITMALTLLGLVLAAALRRIQIKLASRER